MLKTTVGKELASHYSQDALRQIRNWAQQAEQILQSEAKSAKERKHLIAEDYEKDAEDFRKLGVACNRMVMAITKLNRDHENSK